jgi:hypothetical protein
MLLDKEPEPTSRLDEGEWVVKRRKTIWDEFIFYDPVRNKIIRRTRDAAWGGVWENYHYDGEAAWWSPKPAPKHWVLIDRLPEKSL